MSGANAVREDRLWQRHADMAKLGGTPKGGVNRQALSARDTRGAKPARFVGKGAGFRSPRHRQPLRARAASLRRTGHERLAHGQPANQAARGMYGVLAAFRRWRLEDAGADQQR
jgi:N-carbamoyl-L-amino-acid hydrolase